MDPTDEAGRPRVHAGFILLFSAVAGFLVFFGGTFAVSIASGLRPGISQAAVARGIYMAVILGLLAAALALRRSTGLRPYWRLAFAYFVASFAVMLSDLAGNWALTFSGRALNTARGFTALKLGEDAAIIGTIIALTLLTRAHPKESYLSKGRLRLGLIIGIASFLIFTYIGLTSTSARCIPPERLRELLPAFLLIALADGFMEELLFRGLFLRRLGRFVGDHWANLLTAMVFTFMHLGVPFGGSLPRFLIIVFLLGLLWGWIMQKTGSVLASALFHAGVDMLIIADAFTAFGIER